MEASFLDRPAFLCNARQQVRIDIATVLQNREKWTRQKFFLYSIASVATGNKATVLSLQVIAQSHNHFGQFQNYFEIEMYEHFA